MSTLSVVIGVALKGLLGRKLRAVLTALAIVLGVAMISGTFVLTDTIKAAFSTVFTDGLQEHRRGRSPARARSAATRTTTSRRRRFPSRCSRRCARCRASRAPRAASPTRRSSSVATARSSRRGGAPSLALQRPPARRPALQPARAHRRAPGRAARTRSRSTRTTASKKHYTVGDTIGVHRARPGAAVPRSPGSSSFGGVSLARRRDAGDLRPPDGAEALRQGGQARRDRRRREAGVTPSELVARDPAAAAGDRAGAHGRRRRRSRRRRTRTASSTILKYFLLAFGGIALFVGALRDREHARRSRSPSGRASSRRCARSARPRRQVLRSVAARGARDRRCSRSVVGLFLGLGAREGPERALRRASGSTCRRSGTVFATRTIVVSLVVGIVVTLLAVVRPALARDARPADRGRARGRGAAAVALRALRPVRRARRRSSVAVALMLVGLFGGGISTSCGCSRSASALLASSSASRCSRRRSCRRSRACSAGRRRASAARRARSRAATRCGTRSAPPRPRPR